MMVSLFSNIISKWEETVKGAGRGGGMGSGIGKMIK